MLRLKAQWALYLRHDAGVLKSLYFPTPQGENFSPARTGALMQGPFRWQIDECRWVVRCLTTREVLRDLQIAWKLLQTTFVPLCFPAQRR